MSASDHEVQPLADQILELLGVRIKSGQLVIHFDEYRVQRCETNLVHRDRGTLPMRKALACKPNGEAG